jgi:hypothetical protein
MVTNVTIRHKPQLLPTLPAVGKSLSHKPDTVYTKTDTQCCGARRLINMNCRQVMVHIRYASNRVTASSNTQNQKLARSSTSDLATSLNFRAAEFGEPFIRKVALEVHLQCRYLLTHCISPTHHFRVSMILCDAPSRI